MSALIPFSRRSTLHDWIYDIDKLFEPYNQGHKSFTLAGDIEEDEKQISMSFDFPGMKEGDFQVKVEGEKLTISGERKREVKEDKKDKYTFYGRQYGQFVKTFVLPETVDRSQVSAEYRDGVLTIVLPKTEKAKEHVIDVKVSR